MNTRHQFYCFHSILSFSWSTWRTVVQAKFYNIIKSKIRSCFISGRKLPRRIGHYFALPMLHPLVLVPLSQFSSAKPLDVLARVLGSPLFLHRGTRHSHRHHPPPTTHTHGRPTKAAGTVVGNFRCSTPTVPRGCQQRTRPRASRLLPLSSFVSSSCSFLFFSNSMAGLDTEEEEVAR